MMKQHNVIPQEYYTIFGWILALAVPALFYYILNIEEVGWADKYFLTLFSGTLILWMFRLTPYLVPALLLLGGCLLLNIVPDNIILSGFSSNGFFLILSFSFLSAIVLKSNVLMRPTLWLLARIPPRFVILEMFLLGVGFLSSTFINAQINRLDMMTPIQRIILKESGLSENKLACKYLSLVCYAGAIYFSELFLTGKSTNFPVIEMLPAQSQVIFTWNHWLLAASVPVFIMLACIGIPYLLFTRQSIHFSIDKKYIRTKSKELGKFNFSEVIAVIGILLLVFGIVLSSLHIVNLVGFCMALLFFVLLFPILNKQEFRSYINWALLLYIGAIIGIVKSMHYLNLDTALFKLFPQLLTWLTINIYVLIIGVFVLCMVSTLLIGTIPSIILLVPIFLPLADSLNIRPWIIAFTICVACEAWFFPYQSSYQLYYEELIEGDSHFANKNIIKMNMLFAPCRLIGLIASVPFWHYLGLV